MRITAGNTWAEPSTCPREASRYVPRWTGCANRYSPSSATSPAFLSSTCFRDRGYSPSRPRVEAPLPVNCVEKDPGKFTLLLGNVSLAEERIDCKSMPVERFLLRNKKAFSIIFCDPPFPYRYRAELLENLARSPSTASGGLVLIHYPVEDPLPFSIGSLTQEDEREFGRSRVRFYRRGYTRDGHVRMPGRSSVPGAAALSMSPPSAPTIPTWSSPLRT